MTDTIEYRGYTVAVEHDEYPENPFTEWDCEPPLLVAGSRQRYDGYELDATPPTLTREQIKANARDIAQELGCETLLRAVQDYRYDHECGEDAVNEALHEHASGIINAGDLVAFLAECWRWSGCVALDTCSTGYCQGHYADLLLVGTPEWLQESGINPADTDLIEKQLQGAAELYGAWAWGDVYGFVITDPDGEEIDDDDGSCWGFYGQQHEENGLLPTARELVDYEIRVRRRAHLQHLKAMIRNRVPLNIRNARFQEHR